MLGTTNKSLQIMGSTACEQRRRFEVNGCLWKSLCLLLMMGIMTGCATRTDGRRWGQNATFFPGWNRIGKAAGDAFTSPLTWMPIVGALAFRIDNADRTVSDWAVEHTPIFSSPERANAWSDDLDDLARVILYSSVLLTPSGDKASEWFPNKLKGGGVDYITLLFTNEVTVTLKEQVGRTRPDGSNTRSFPSGHSSSMAARSTLAYRNLQMMDLPDSTMTVAGIGLTSMTLLGSWARVEAGVHYPSDVLAGLAIGHFLSATINDAFLGEDSSWEFNLIPAKDGCVISVGFKF